MSNFRKELLTALGVDAPANPAQELLITAAERFKHLADISYQRMQANTDGDSAIALGNRNAFIKSTKELLAILKLLGVLNPTQPAKQKQLSDFFKKTKGKQK